MIAPGPYALRPRSGILHPRKELLTGFDLTLNCGAVLLIPNPRRKTTNPRAIENIAVHNHDVWLYVGDLLDESPLGRGKRPRPNVGIRANHDNAGIDFNVEPPAAL